MTADLERVRVVAFLQNVWVRDPEHVRRSITRGVERYGESFRRRYIARLLFMGCLTGRRIKAAFGEELCRSIVWEEVSREILGDPRIVPAADDAHIQSVLDTLKPGVVVTFGRVAQDAIARTTPRPARHHIIAPHPAARQASVPGALALAAEHLRTALLSLLEGEV